jgi:hypothetical protein
MVGERSYRLAVDGLSGVFSDGPCMAWVNTTIILSLGHAMNGKIQFTLRCIDEVEEERVGGAWGSLFTENLKWKRLRGAHPGA